jgi:hypothetical protein
MQTPRAPGSHRARGTAVDQPGAVTDITPDDKDWTWVLERPCPECGFDGRGVDPTTVGDRVRDNAAAWQAVLARPDVAVRSRPDRWSPLEYACHVRDVLRLYLERLDLMLTQDGPHYPNWDQDATAVEQRYGEQLPATVAVELARAAAALADRFDEVEGEQWSRTGFRSDGAAFTVDTFARYFVHDPIHHLWDVSGS